MPAKNTVKQYAADMYYHVYNRGVAKQVVFHDAEDKKHFLKIIGRHLDPENTDVRYDGAPYEKYEDQLELLCYCLMGNHFHLLLYMKNGETAVKKFMHSLSTSYTMYYNKKYHRVGALFQGTFKASRIQDEAYLLHITRYIHMNPRGYKNYFYSSYKNYVGKTPDRWLKPERILSLFSSVVSYAEFCEDYRGYSESIGETKGLLANE
jgi:putative transposase